ncbi:MAG: helix-turn-helix transcriptional regulator [Clostridia bacterium]|nr:helix-turn-helix transcriptional regulator [Clostridia bacterium]
MNDSFHTASFAFEYLESEIENTVLWESHCHSQYELIAVVEGRIGIMIEGRSYSLSASQAVIIPPLSYHTVTASKKGVYKRVTVLFARAAIPSVLASRFTKDGFVTPLFRSARLDELRKICQSEDIELYAPLAESLMIQTLYECIEAESAGMMTEVDELLHQIISYVDSHLGEKIRLEDLAVHTARSQSSICHLFREQMKISPKQYILQKKLALAATLIRDGTPPTVAAMRIGYDNYSDFYRIYLKHVQKTPSKDKI